ncbi:MAG: DPP IV N-terminal domain-containing protein [Candidatus Poribacteria bacterium]|nr:DPP IV N-terminal domain-containing protein [Candidatus Poribacteria bacterium]
MKHALRYTVLWGMLILLVGNVQAAGIGTLSFSTNPRSPDLYLVDSTGQNLRRLVTDNINKGSPTWMPDGRFFAYISNHDGDSDIYIMDVRNKTSRQLTNHPDRDLSPEWSPNGKWIAFVSNRAGDLDIYRIDVDGSNLMRLTKWGNNKYPAWSPDSQWIAFVSSRNEKKSLSIMNADGNRVRQLGEASFKWGGCTWSPDGTQIAFSDWDPEVEGINIFIVDTDGKNKHHLTREEPKDLLFDPKVPLAYQPAWSPDGHCIAYILEYLRVPKPEDPQKAQKDRKVIFPLVPRDGVICIANAFDKDREKLLLGTQAVATNLSPTWVPETFFSVSPQPELLTTQWGEIKKE